MSYLITNIRSAQPISGKRYLFDANVWLAILDLNFQTGYTAPYENFFNAVYGSQLNPAPTIVFPSLLISEVLNRLVNDIYYKEFCKNHPKPLDMNKHKHFKDVYRPSSEYKNDLFLATGSIRTYGNKVQLLSDHLDQMTYKNLLTDIPLHLDFNDHFFCELAKKQNLIIVTGDKDFRIEDVPIITAHPYLLKLR